MRYRIIWLLVLALISGACAPRFKGEGQLVPQSKTVSSAQLPSEADSKSTSTSVGADATQNQTTKATSRTQAVRTAADVAVKRGDTIKIGGLFPLSGGLSALGTPAYQSASAYFRALNARGGIDGTKIEFVTCDDQAEDTRSTTCAKKLVESDGVFMMGPSFTPFSLTVIGQLESGGVPWVGYDGINVEGFKAANVVTVGAPIETMAHALFASWYGDTEKRLGHAPKKIGAVVLQSAPSKTYAREVRDVICPKLGCEITRQQDINFADTEYATICRNMQNDRVDAVWIVTDPASAVKLYVQCREIGYTPPGGWLGQHGIYMDLTLNQSGAFADGTVANGAVLPDTVDDPANTEMKKIVSTYYRDASFGYFASLGYASARLVEDVLREAFRSSDKLTRASVLAAASRMSGYDCHGLCRDVNLAPPAAVHGGNHNIWIVKATGGRWLKSAGPIDAWKTSTWPRPGRP